MWGKPTNTTTTRKTGYGMTTRAVGWFIQLEYVSCKKCDWLSMYVLNEEIMLSKVYRSENKKYTYIIHDFSCIY